MNMYHWKWSLGEPYYKSARLEKEVANTTEIVSEYDTQQSAINQSLEEELSTSNSNSNNSKREELDNKMADRELVLQRGANPFLQQSSYVNDIVVRDMFLKPINTSQEKIKNIEENI